MKSTALYGKKRESFGTSSSNELRRQGFVPCVLYSGEGETLHFYAFYNDFRHFLGRPELHKITLHIDGKQYEAVVREAQYHPLSDDVLHVDFLQVTDEKVITIEIPVRLVGSSRGVRNGGRLVKKVRKLKIKGPTGEIPEAVDIDITNLRMGKSLKVKDVKVPFEILTSPAIPIATVEVPRNVKGTEMEEEDEEDAVEETAEAGEEKAEA